MSRRQLQKLNEEVFGTILSASGVFTGGTNKQQQRRRKTSSTSSSSKTLTEEESSPPITTTMYINYYQQQQQNDNSLSSIEASTPSSAATTTSIFTSLGGEDDDNNDNNNNNNNTPNLWGALGLGKTCLWFLVGSICSIPFTEFVLDPIILMWSMAFFGWLSYEEYDYPTDDDDDDIDQDNGIHYPGCTDRQYFMTDEEEVEEQEYQHQRHQQQERPLPFDARYQSRPPPRGGNTMTPRPTSRTTTTPTIRRPRRRSMTFFGIQAGMIVLGDWLVRCLLLPRTSMDGIGLIQIPGWLNVCSFPLQVLSMISSMVVQFRIQQHQMDLSQLFSATSASSNISPSSQQQVHPQHPIPYWLGYYMDHIAILLPIALLAFEFLFDSNILWTCLTRLLSRHVGLDNHGTFQPFLVNRAL